MKLKVGITLLFSILFLYPPTVFCQSSGPAPLTVDEIIDRVEARYAAPGFSAEFLQTSTLKAMEITDRASGRIFVKRPGMMRWEYAKPDLQTIVTDGRRLWIYRPEDSQVMIGKAPAFFGDGKGAGFLADIRQIRRQFFITLANKTVDGHYRLNLFPLTKTFDLEVVHLSISAQTFDVVRVVTYNSYGDTTRIDLSHIQLEQALDDNLFTFTIPQGVEVLYLDE
jgi:outer membrane lipoprotein carrier protein